MSSTLPAPRPLSLTRSKQLLEKAQKIIPGLTQSMMKRPEQFAPGSFPVYLARGEGALVTDVDGKQYIDFICGLAANSLGHQHPLLVEAVQNTLAAGFIHSLPTEIELTTTEALLDAVPHAEMARFFKTGADATSAAIRLARFITKKDRIITIGYNGWHDHFMYDTPGVPAVLQELTQRMPLFQPSDEEPLLQAVAQGAPQLAAVLLSIPFNRQISREFLVKLRETCTQHGVLLIFDEIITGFRLARGGLQEFFQVQADYVCFSKALASGMPLSAVVGPREFLQHFDGLQVSTTFGGEMLSLAVCEASLRVYKNTNYFEHIARLGRQLREGLQKIAAELEVSLEVHGYDPIPFLRFHPNPAQHGPLMQEFQAQMAPRGVLLRREVNFICGAHTEEQIQFTIEAARESLSEMKKKGLFPTA